MQQQASTEPREVSVSSNLELRLLDNGIPDSDISDCVVAHNSEWRGFFELTPEIMEQRLRSGELFLGVRKKGKLVGYLETMSHYVKIPNMPADTDEPDTHTALRIANFVSGQIKGDYFKHAPDGKWPKRPENANVIRFVSINVIPDEREYGYGGQMIDYIKQLLRMPAEERPEQLRDIVVSLTDTPVKPLPQKFHQKYGALDTHYLEPGFRPGYDAPDIKRFCYLAPGFKPWLRT